MSLASLAGRVRRMRAQLRRNPKTWVFVMEAGRELPEHVRAQFAPEDTVCIREYPPGLLGDLETEGYKLCWTV
jgi:hypothetical protein